MIISLPVSMNHNESIQYQKFYEDGVKILSDFAIVNGLGEYSQIPFIMEMKVFDRHDEFITTLSQRMQIEEDGILTTHCAIVHEGVLYIMTDQYYSEVYPQGIEPFSYSKLIAHELAHILHIRCLNGEASKMGPIWFREGLAIFASNQFSSTKTTLSKQHISKILSSNTKAYYLYFGQLVRKLLEKTNLLTAIAKAFQTGFSDWVKTLILSDELLNEDDSQELNENIIDITYLDGTKRDLVLILPGGAYSHTSPREGNPVSSRFQKNGFHTAIYSYRIQMLRHPFLVEEGIRKVKELKEDPLVDQIIVIGFSAGGHFALLLLEKIPSLFRAGILCYPVVTTNPSYIHAASFTNLFGKRPSRVEAYESSLEKHVSSNMPPMFIWHTMEDQSVKVENSLLLVNALRKAGVKTEVHLYPSGPHGLSLADETTPFDGVDPKTFKEQYLHVSHWVEQAIRFINEV